MITVSSSVPNLHQIFPFPLDDFQQQAIAALDAHKSVVVCAPTGSGKTLIGEYAIHRAIARGKRVFYTTPLKALSNQKLRDFREQFGVNRVGLLTGDLSLNRDAAVLVMTTEIFRNMLYGTPIGEISPALVDVEAVVLDECHYMNDRSRGTVWEESIIYCPSAIQLVALSATIANSDQLTHWLQQVHGSTELIYSDFRPVPLNFSFCTDGGLYPLLDDGGRDLHPNFKARLKKQKAARHDRHGNRRQPTVPSIAFVVSRLYERDMLPAIYFIFSRKGCDRAVADCRSLSLVTPEESAIIRTQVNLFLRQNAQAAKEDQIEALCQGIAAHHAGLLPAWKGLVEELFQQGLVRVVFATETLAAGINMPARTTVISALSKRTDDGHRLLNPSEFLQMAGRAGRRGMDPQGYVVTVQNRFQGVKEAGQIAMAQAEPLVSQFTPSYGMVLNLLQTHTLPEAQNLVERSFGRYLAMLTLQPQQEALAAVQGELEELQEELGSLDWAAFEQYEKLKERLREEERLLQTLEHQATEHRAEDMTLALAFAVAGTILSLQGKHVNHSAPLPGVLVGKAPGSNRSPYLICLGWDNCWYVVTTLDVAAIHGEVPRLAMVDSLFPPPDLSLRPGQCLPSNDSTVAIVHQLQTMVQRHNLTPESHQETLDGLQDTGITEQWQRTEMVRRDLENHPVHRWQGHSQLRKKRRRLERLEEEYHDRQRKLESFSHRHWQEFLNLLQVLQDFGAMEGTTPTSLGENIAALRGENELWLGLAFSSGLLDNLAPQDLAAACHALICDITRPDLWVRYDVPGEVETSLEQLRPTHRRLFQVQARHQVSLPACYDLPLTGLVEQWALGVTWWDLCANTSLDEGDVVRMLRRVLDLLNQLPHLPNIAPELKRNASRAVYLIDRFPIRDLITVPVEDLEGDLEEDLEEEPEIGEPEIGEPEIGEPEIGELD
ncbi:DEAD/DEAH box helicase [Prochlorothrix hollandica]|uniref:DEAD/DEAH box helicase n=1 Tax=Prochlorothrix hollandica TaxID=1223 RepID=UPI0033420E4D